MLARLQQRITLGLLAAALAWVWLWWSHSPVTAAVGALLLLFGHAVFLGLECLAMVRVNRADPAPRATGWQVLRAWMLESVTAPRVFCWRQPFFSNAEPDFLPASAQGRQGVVLVHGFVCNRGFWTPWLKVLRQRGQPFIAVDLEPVRSDMEAYRPILEAAVGRITAATGRPPILVCHSMGGLVARDWLRSVADDRRVAAVVTLGSPHQGAWLSRYAIEGSALQMRCDGAWLQALAASESPSRRALFTCWYSNCDNIVFPTSTATLQGADNRFVDGLPHVAMAFDRKVMAEVLRKIEG